MRLAMACAAALLVATHATPALAGPPSRLVYSRAAGAESCADEAAMRAAVARRVGYEPFVPSAHQTVMATMAPAANRGFVARVRLIDDRGVEYGTREFHVDGACADLLDTAALAIAIAIDPQVLAPRTATRKPATPPAPFQQLAPGTQDDEPDERTPMAPTDNDSGILFDGSLGAELSAGVAPALTAGAALGAVARWHDVSLGLEAAVDAPASTPARGGGRVSAWLATGRVAPCAHAGPTFTCALFEGGRIRATGEAPGGAVQGAPWWAAGVRFGVLASLGGPTALRVHTDVVVDLAPSTFQLNGFQLPKAPPVAETLGVDVVLHFR